MSFEFNLSLLFWIISTPLLHQRFFIKFLFLIALSIVIHFTKKPLNTSKFVPYSIIISFIFSRVKFWSCSNLKSIFPLKYDTQSGSWTSSKYLCFKASSAVILFSGSYYSILLRRSSASLFSYLTNSLTWTLGLFGRDWMNFIAFGFLIIFISSCVGIPK